MFTTAVDSIDFAALWRAYKRQDAQGRVEASSDLAFWEATADSYDTSHHNCPETLKVLYELVRPDDTLLDIGAGTGRFSLPLATAVQHLTALDHAPAMLNILRQKVICADVQNITLVESALEKMNLPPHDVVLAAWSLYRQVDINLAMRNLIAATRRLLIIIESDDDVPHAPHQALITEMWGRPHPRNLSKYLCFVGVLWQLGFQAGVKIVQETSHFYAATPQKIAAQFAPEQATVTELAHFTDRLSPWLQAKEDHWCYSFTHPVELIIWQRL